MKVYINPHRLWAGSFVPEWLEKSNEASDGAKLLYARMCRYAGKDGTCYPRIDTLASDLGKSERQVQRLMKELTDTGLIESRRRGLGKSNVYLFLEPQDDKDVSSDPSRMSAQTRQECQLADDKYGGTEENHLRESIEDNGHANACEGESPYAKGKNDKRDHVFEAIAKECYGGWEGLTATERGRTNRAAKELRGATPEAIRARAGRYRQKYPDAPLTPQALTGNWSQLGEDIASDRRRQSYEAFI